MHKKSASLAKRFMQWWAATRAQWQKSAKPATKQQRTHHKPKHTHR